MNEDNDIDASSLVPDEVGFGAYDDESGGDANAISYHCCRCKEKHASNGEELYLPCCDAAICRDAFNGLLHYGGYGWWHGGVACPACKARLPTFMVLNRPSRRLVRASHATALLLSMIIKAGQLASWAVSPGLPLAVLLFTAYVALNVLGFCVNIASSAGGFCFDAMADLRAWTMAVAAELPNASFMQVSLLRALPWATAPHPSFVLMAVCAVVAFTLCYLAGWRILRPRLESGFRRALQKHASLYYSPENTF